MGHHNESKSAGTVYKADGILENDLLPSPHILEGVYTRRHFLVRAEYIRMYDFVQETYDGYLNVTNNFQAVVVAGQPGIGNISKFCGNLLLISSDKVNPLGLNTPSVAGLGTENRHSSLSTESTTIILVMVSYKGKQRMPGLVLRRRHLYGASST